MIGCLHQSDTSGSTHALRLTRHTPRGLVAYDSLLLTILWNTLKEASYVFTATNINENYKHSSKFRKKIEYSRQAFALVSGTGLDIMFEKYQINYDPEEVRYAFYAKFGVKETA